MTALLTLPLAFLAQLFADALKAVPGFRVVSRTQIVPCHGQLIVAVTDPLPRMSLSALIAGWIAERMSLGPLSVCSVGSATPPAAS